MTKQDVIDRNYEQILDLEWSSRVMPETFTKQNLETLELIVERLKEKGVEK